MQDARTRIGVAIVAAVAIIAIGIGVAVKKLQSPPPIVITDPAGASTATASGPPMSLAEPPVDSPAVVPPKGLAPAADSSSAPSQSPSADSASSAPVDIYIHVAGAVKKPGLYTLPPDSRLFQALKAAGGAKADADLDAVNLAEKLADGEKVYVPSEQEMKSTPSVEAAGAGNAIGEESETPADATADSGVHAAKGAGGHGGRSDKLTDPSQGTVDINTADAGELQRLPGVGPAMAARIIAFRQSAGGFKKPEELMEVSGIGPKKYAKMQPFIHT